MVAKGTSITMIPVKLPTYQASEPAWLLFNVRTKKVAAPEGTTTLCVGNLIKIDYRFRKRRAIPREPSAAPSNITVGRHPGPFFGAIIPLLREAALPVWIRIVGPIGVPRYGHRVSPLMTWKNS